MRVDVLEDARELDPHPPLLVGLEVQAGEAGDVADGRVVDHRARC